MASIQYGNDLRSILIELYSFSFSIKNYSRKAFLLNKGCGAIYTLENQFRLPDLLHC